MKRLVSLFFALFLLSSTLVAAQSQTAPAKPVTQSQATSTATPEKKEPAQEKKRHKAKKAKKAATQETKKESEKKP